jgi:adenine-specific DNA-methyltransferase
MFEADEDGDLYLADWAIGGELARAVCAQVRYEYEPIGPFTGHRGRSRLAVLDGMLTTGVTELLLSKLADRETLLVVAQAVEPGVEELLAARRSGSKVRKMPRDLARRGILPSRLVTLTTAPDGVFA